MTDKPKRFYQHNGKRYEVTIYMSDIDLSTIDEKGYMSCCTAQVANYETIEVNRDLVHPH